VLSAQQDRNSVVKALDLGALGFITKSGQRDVMLGALRLVFAGGKYIPPEAIEREEPADLGLTGRQLDVLALMMQGKSNKAICRLLDLSEPTVKSHVSAILRALRKRPGDRDLPEAPLVAPRVLAVPLALFERDGLKAALKKAGLASDDVDRPDLLFWRFETQDAVPVGFGGLEIHDSDIVIDDKVRSDLDRLGISRAGALVEIFGRDALLRSLVILPPLRRKGFGAATVAALELEARVLGCRTIYLQATDTAFFVRLGYSGYQRSEVPEWIAESRQFKQQAVSLGEAMVKNLA
jgi:GNAT superfamily N-acetyltransferase